MILCIMISNSMTKRKEKKKADKIRPQFNTLIINGFGYDKFQTILMGLPAAAFQITNVIFAAILTTNIRRSRLLVLSGVCLIAIPGILMIKLLPNSKKLPRLAGFWLTTSVSPAFPLMMSLFASNTAGFTKKSSVVGLIFVGYCLGNFVGPQFFRSEEAPGYEVGRNLVRIAYQNTYKVPNRLRL